MAIQPIIVADGNVASLMSGVRVSITGQLKLCDDVLDTDGVTVLKTASQVACELVAAETGVEEGQLSAVQFESLKTFQITAEPRKYTSSEVVIEIPPDDGGDGGDTPDPV